MIAVTTPMPPGTPQPGPWHPTAAPIFPAAVTPDAADVHPLFCACDPCTDALLLRLARPLTAPGPLTDPALRGRTDHPHGHVGEADARLDAAGRTATREAPTGGATPAGAGDSSPDRAVAQPGRPSSVPARSGATQGAAGTGAYLPHPLRGGEAA